ncbi:hypothetical protein CKO25_05125 [Thiocapsa imhoffii]|uniref:Uncharacterized protein n=2 Tax=Thiocapsa imhoffii TaxID=382777 RepID=A0A9X1B8J9_9GAMM|nr:hypothetical protein [Thiocapsa imhoffii]
MRRLTRPEAITATQDNIMTGFSRCLPLLLLAVVSWPAGAVAEEVTEVTGVTRPSDLVADPVADPMADAAERAARSDALSEQGIPAALRPWIPWVLERGPAGRDQRACPIAPLDAAPVCAWPGRLELRIDERGGSFAIDWEVLAESRVPLPGDAQTAWPLEVMSHGRDLPVVIQDDRPSVTLEPGWQRVTGRFLWDHPPDALAIPPMIGLIELERDGHLVPVPALDQDRRIWLTEPRGPETARAGDQLNVEVARRITDRLPLEVLTRLQLEVSGAAREIRLGPVPLPGGIPLRLASPLPARLDEDGSLRVQVRPGRWELEVTTQHPGDVTTLSRAPAAAPWPVQEIWAFAAEPALRRVELTGLTAVDPRQTGLPHDWMQLPTFMAGPTDQLTLANAVRGDPDPGPDRLRLERHLWLDFDGKGYSVQDRIEGELTRGWRLDAGPRLDLGQVRIDGEPVLITHRDGEAPPGVEVRRGRLDLVADARLDAMPGQVPAAGWAVDFERVQTRLDLPPGWKLLMVQGVDNLPDTWVGRWTLLDLFLVLIVALGIGRIWGWGWGLVALVTLGLTWQSDGAPRLVWLNLLGAAALLRLLPLTTAKSGLHRLRLLVSSYFRLSLLALVLIALPFLVTQVRDGLFPQLERPAMTLPGQAAPGVGLRAPILSGVAAGVSAQRERIAASADELSSEIDTVTRNKQAVPLERLDPTAQLQTGPGIPQWGWNRYELRWTGPVGAQDQARLWLLSPFWNLLISLIGVILVVVLGLRLAGVLGDPTPGHPPGGNDAVPSSGPGPVPRAALRDSGLRLVWAPLLSGPVLAALVLGVLCGSGPASADPFPSPSLLDELEARLRAPPECLPHCVELASMRLSANPERLVIALTIDSAAAVATPIPGGAGGWSPERIEVAGEPRETLLRDSSGRLLLALGAGRHQILLEGSVATRDQVEILLPMPPRTLALRIEGWELEGLDANGRPGEQIRLIRRAETPPSGVEEVSLTPGALPPLLRVERTLRFGIDWRVETRVERLSPSDVPVLLPIPLLPGEAVQTPGIQVERGAVLADLPSGRSQMRWTSRLDPVTELSLTASLDPRLSEDWRLDVSPLWHLEFSGPAPIHRLGPADRWLPNWRPLPGETLTLSLSRPVAVPGPTLTIDRVGMQVEPSHRGTLATLTLALRSSQGGRHLIRLPEQAEPVALRRDGQSVPLPDTLPDWELPLTPGASVAEIVWRQPQGLSWFESPQFPDLGAPAVNLNLSLRLPEDRWVLLTGGPRMGPAVLFWGVLLVLVGLALVLGRSRLTPLRMHDWLLLGIGLSLAHLWVVLLVIGWLFALGFRHRLDPQASPPWRFNLVQIGLMMLTLAALVGLLSAVQQGLLGPPAMQIMGHGSSATLLNWYQDRGGPLLPEIWVLSVPMWVYRALMLAWALWLALRLLDWLRWGWQGLSTPMLWRETRVLGAQPDKTRTGSERDEMRLDL